MGRDTLRLLKILLRFVVVMILAVIGYSVYVVFDAINDTPEIVESMMSSDDLTLQLGDFPEGWLDALISVEDPNFYGHNGLDLKTPGSGRTTITQAVTRNLYFDDFTPGFDELRRGLIAFFVLDPKVPKDTQLLFFVNTVYLGRQEGRLVHGFDRGAEVYFDKEFGELTYDEYLALVAMIVSPSTYHVLTFPGVNAERVERIRALLDGDYVPMDATDIYYDKAGASSEPSGTYPEE